MATLIGQQYYLVRKWPMAYRYIVLCNTTVMLLSAGTSVVWQWQGDVYTVYVHSIYACKTYRRELYIHWWPLVKLVLLCYICYYCSILGSCVDHTFNHLVVHSLTRGWSHWCINLVVCDPVLVIIIIQPSTKNNKKYG